MPLRWSILAGVAGQKPRRPQFVPIAQFLRLPARQRHQPRLGLDGDRRLSAKARPIIQCGHRAFDRSPLNATLDCLMMQPERLAHCKKRWIFPIPQQDPRPFDPARRFRSRLRYRPQLCRIRIFERQLIARLHAAMVFNPSFKSH